MRESLTSPPLQIKRILKVKNIYLKHTLFVDQQTNRQNNRQLMYRLRDKSCLELLSQLKILSRQNRTVEIRFYRNALFPVHFICAVMQIYLQSYFAGIIEFGHITSAFRQSIFNHLAVTLLYHGHFCKAERPWLTCVN